MHLCQKSFVLDGKKRIQPEVCASLDFSTRQIAVWRDLSISLEYATVVVKESVFYFLYPVVTVDCEKMRSCALDTEICQLYIL